LEIPVVLVVWFVPQDEVVEQVLVSLLVVVLQQVIVSMMALFVLQVLALVMALVAPQVPHQEKPHWQMIVNLSCLVRVFVVPQVVALVAPQVVVLVVPQAQALPWAVALVQVQAADIATAHLLGCFVVVVALVVALMDQVGCNPHKCCIVHP
jgi:hypothetical protein